jgi:hypothetical protein
MEVSVVGLVSGIVVVVLSCYWFYTVGVKRVTKQSKENELRVQNSYKAEIERIKAEAKLEVEQFKAQST